MQRPSRYVSVPFPRGRVNCHGYVNAQAIHGRRPCRSSELCNGHSFRDDEANACRNHRTPLGPSPSWLIQRGGITERCPLLPPPWASTRIPHHIVIAFRVRKIMVFLWLIYLILKMNSFVWTVIARSSEKGRCVIFKPSDSK